jgi:1-deoxyxylulose-5-phosphate synthase
MVSLAIINDRSISMSHERNVTRRKFIGGLAATTAGLAAIGHLTRAAGASVVRLTATDQVPLGKCGVKFSRLGFGTGSMGGQVQRGLGQEKFTALVRYALDKGITYMDTADTYTGMHVMLREALKGVDRAKIQIQCKIPPGRFDDPAKEIDRYRAEVGTDYFDTMLIHCVQTTDWAERFKKLRDVLDELKEKKVIRATGVSMHGLPGLRGVADGEWGDVRLVRINHNGTHMDGATGKWAEPGEMEPALECVRRMHAAGKGIIAMKLIGNGEFTDAETREKSIRFVMGLECVDAAVIGFKTPAEIDEAIARMNSALGARAARMVQPA